MSLAHWSDVVARSAPDRRSQEKRCGQDRRKGPGVLDVARIEHENLFKQVEEHDRAIRRLEGEVRRIHELMVNGRDAKELKEPGPPI
jgi:hypothetical protein